jgi:hypothetical protein
MIAHFSWEGFMARANEKMAQANEKGIKQFKNMIARWEEEDAEFNRFITRRSDTLKMLGAGNATGALALAAFLTTATRLGAVLVSAKICLFIFFVGFGAFVVAYRSLYNFGSDLEDALTLLRNGENVDSDPVETIITAAVKKSERSGVLNLTAFACLLFGGLWCCIGLLLI